MWQEGHLKERCCSNASKVLKKNEHYRVSQPTASNAARDVTGRWQEQQNENDLGALDTDDLTLPEQVITTAKPLPFIGDGNHYWLGM